MCAKLLLGMGAEHTGTLTPEAKKAIDAAPIEKIRDLVRSEKVRKYEVQERRTRRPLLSSRYPLFVITYLRSHAFLPISLPVY